MRALNAVGGLRGQRPFEWRGDFEMIWLEWLGLSATVLVAFVLSSWMSSSARGARAGR
jgi:hypothetical protein